MESLHVSIPDVLKKSVEKRVRGGRFSNKSDYVRQLIREDVEREAMKKEFFRVLKPRLNSPILPESPFTLLDMVEKDVLK